MSHGDGHPVPGAEVVVRAPLQGTVAGVPVAVGDVVVMGAPVVILESMKMEHVVGATAQGTVVSLDVEPGATVAAGEPLAVIEAAAATGPAADARAPVDLDEVRPDL
ncbi:MAG: biotin/lipoyl-containing protein, partial [Acidimicrobiales bacterium]